MSFPSASGRRPLKSVLAVALVLVYAGHTSRGAALVKTAHHGNDASTPPFTFDEVEPPRRSAALAAVFSLVDGEPDPNGATLDALHDGDLPSEADQPEANFFFRGEGGRIVVDLGRAIPIAEVDSYSWHPGGRCPQVYALYGADGTAHGFQARPRRPMDPAAGGWKLLAQIDTRPQHGAPGGQQAVSIGGPAGAVLGTCRYLLFDVAPGTAGNPNTNTFFSEVVILEHGVPPGPRLVSREALPVNRSTVYHGRGRTLTLDNDDPTLDAGVQDRLVQTFLTAYAEEADAFNKDAPTKVTISIERRYRGVAATADDKIHVNPGWLRKNPEDTDLIVHEAMHLVQAYRRGSPPGWLVEGIADYARYRFGVNNARAGWALPKYDPSQHHDDSYRVTARFLVWLEAHGQPGLVQKLDAALRGGEYTAATWDRLTGRSVEQLWRSYAGNPGLAAEGASPGGR